MLAPVFCKFSAFCELQKLIIMTKKPAIGFFSDPKISTKILVPYYLLCCLNVIVFAILALHSILTRYVSVVCPSHIVLLHIVYLKIRYNKW